MIAQKPLSVGHNALPDTAEPGVYNIHHVISLLLVLYIDIGPHLVLNRSHGLCRRHVAYSVLKLGQPLPESAEIPQLRHLNSLECMTLDPVQLTLQLRVLFALSIRCDLQHDLLRQFVIAIPECLCLLSIWTVSLE